MHPSQVVLLLLIGLFAVYIVRLRSTSGDRIVYLGLAAIGAVFIVRPEWTNSFATLLGIGRGADLMFYFFIVFCLFHFATTAATLRRMQRDLSAVARAIALDRAVTPSDASSDRPV